MQSNGAWIDRFRLQTKKLFKIDGLKFGNLVASGRTFCVIIFFYLFGWIWCYDHFTWIKSFIKELSISVWISLIGIETKKLFKFDRLTIWRATLYKNLNIDKIRTTAFHPQTDGLVERVNRTLKSMLASYTNDNPTDWDNFLPYLTFAYNTSVQTSTNETPHYLLFGCDPIEPQDVVTLTRYRFVDDYNMIFLQHFHDARELARTHLILAQNR